LLSAEAFLLCLLWLWLLLLEGVLFKLRLQQRAMVQQLQDS
jgi:hypothetical protein